MVEAKQRIQLQKNKHTASSHPLFLIQTPPPCHFHCHPIDTHPEPPIQKTQTMSSNSSITYSQSSNGSQASDAGSSSSSNTGLQLRSSTHGHNSDPASQQMHGDSQVTPPKTQDTIHLWQDRTTALSAQSATSGQNTPDVDINVVL